MKVNDKVIVAFLVSLGIFSTTQAMQYVRTLSMKNKKELISIAKLKNKNIVLCENTTFPTENKKTRS
jgi:1-deoxy-D-xylulose 5-phosphate reductoisomerase